VIKKLINILLRRFDILSSNSEEILHIKYPFSTEIIDSTFKFQDSLIKEFKNYALEDLKIKLDNIYIILGSYSNLNLDSSNHQLNSETVIKIIKKNNKYTGLIFLYSDLN
jgi:hypothetical protein